MEHKRTAGQFASSAGFILAAVGSAVGMGNIWLFPYRIGQYGGGAFLVPYFIFVALFSYVGLSGEFGLGRLTGTGTSGSFDYVLKSGEKKGGSIIGILPLLGVLGIAIGYSVVVGWVLKYTVGSLTGAVLTNEPQAYFDAMAVDFGSIPWHLIAVVLTAAVLLMGVKDGIEKISKFMMPAFFILFFIIAIRVAFLPGSWEGYLYLLTPDWSYLGKFETWVMAMGQAFFSLSLAGSGTIVYGSYLKKDVDVVSCAKNVAFFDTCAALLAGVVVIPAVFAFGLDVASGPPLMFISLPAVFQQMPFGEVFAVIFFVAVLFAALTSLMNLFETPIEALQQQFKLSRKAAVGIVAAVSAGVGVFIESGDSVGAWMDAVSIYIIPLGALLAGIIFYWVCPKGFAREQVETGAKKPLGIWFEPVTKYVFVGITLVVYVLGIFFGGIG